MTPKLFDMSQFRPVSQSHRWGERILINSFAKTLVIQSLIRFGRADLGAELKSNLLIFHIFRGGSSDILEMQIKLR